MKMRPNFVRVKDNSLLNMIEIDKMQHQKTQLQQEHDRLCLTLLQGIEADDTGCRIVNDSLVSRAVEMAMS